MADHQLHSKVAGKWSNYKGKNQSWPQGCRPKKNFIFMVSDGFGTASETIAREYFLFQQYGKDLNKAFLDTDSILPLDSLLVGSSRTKSSDSWVTDSASAATAMASGFKTYNEAIGVDANKVPGSTVLEAAKYKGYTTGLVATSRVTHATPASWSAHVVQRDDEDVIAAQQIGDNVLGRQVDLMIGGGRGFFLPKSLGSKVSSRPDERDLTKEAVEKYGFKKVVLDRDALLALKEDSANLPLLGLFTKSHMSYEIDRDATKEPSLAEMAHAALSMLAEKSSDCHSPGFFVMIEGSRIDHASHSNDAAAHIRDILAYQDAVSVVKDFVKQNPNTAAISVSDHECGGVTAGLQNDLTIDPAKFYRWNAENMKATASIESFYGPLLKAPEDANLEKLIKDTVAAKLGVTDVTAAEMTEVLAARKVEASGVTPLDYPFQWALARLVVNRTLVGFSTHGHTGMDVNLYAINAPGLKGSVDNTYLAEYSAKFLEVDDVMPMLTQRLAKQKTVRDGPKPAKRSVDLYPYA
ncbi:alkaline-phosphatase-like protein [Blastocladiella britannica]|nr:alkaline-phosphatase-like protein [Blastocladiella britannica]